MKKVLRYLKVATNSRILFESIRFHSNYRLRRLCLTLKKSFKIRAFVVKNNY